MTLRRRKLSLVEETPTTSYAEIRSHRSGGLVGYVPDDIFDAVTGRTSRDGVWFLSREESDVLRSHPQFLMFGSEENTPQ